MASTDRLSGLSDDILRHILSFLPTKLSVSTCILAKRWRFLWAHVPSLRFEGEISLDVVHRVIVLHELKNNLDTFSLSDMRRCNERQIETLIITAIDRYVRKLHLLRVKVALPQCLFTSKTLVELRLDKCVGILSGGSPTNLPSLKRLYLHGFTYLVEEALPRLLSGCPVLEELCIINGTLDPNLCCLDISSSSLKKLEIDCVISPHQHLRVVINAPTLRYLKVYTGYIQQLSLSPMTSLIEADMRLYCWTLSPGSLFASFPNLKCLKLSGSPWKFSGVAGSVVKFNCLTKLELRFSIDWDELFEFLEIADKLEVLITNQVGMPSNRGDLMNPRKGCLLHSLKTLTILHFGCSEKELCVLKYVLRNAIVLKKVDIYSGSISVLDLRAKYDMVKRILVFDRGSTECKVAFDEICIDV